MNSIKKVIVTKDCMVSFNILKTVPEGMLVKDIYNFLGGHPFIPDNREVDEDDKINLANFLNNKRDLPEWEETKHKLIEHIHSKGYLCFEIND